MTPKKVTLITTLPREHRFKIFQKIGLVRYVVQQKALLKKRNVYSYNNFGQVVPDFKTRQCQHIAGNCGHVFIGAPFPPHGCIKNLMQPWFFLPNH
jgi:hypothetical protein